MSVRILPDYLINQIAAGEVVENGASVVKELVENALDAGANQIIVDIVDGGRTLINVVDNGSGMSRDDLKNCIMRHATSKLPDDNLMNINFMGFRGEALPSIASVSDMAIDTCNGTDENGWHMDCNTGEIRPSDWQSGTRIRVQNLFAKTPARLKFLRSDRVETMAVLDVIKRLGMARNDVGFVLNNKWRFEKDQPLIDRIVAVMGDDVRGRMRTVSAESGAMKLTGYISEPTLRRASSVDQFLFVNGRPVKDKVLVGALRAAYMDVMHAREFPLCALYLTLPSANVDVNVSPTKNDVHFLEPSHVRAFIIKALREVLAQNMVDCAPAVQSQNFENKISFDNAPIVTPHLRPVSMAPMVHSPNAVQNPFAQKLMSDFGAINEMRVAHIQNNIDDIFDNMPLGRVIGQIANKYILSATADSLVVVDQHAAHERITYEKLRTHTIKSQPLLTPIVVRLRAEDVVAVLSIADDLRESGLHIDSFGDDAVAIFEKPADWDMDWASALHAIADEVRAYGHSSGLQEKLHLKLANYACHHSVRAGQKLNMEQMNALLRDIEKTEHGGECNHGRPVYKFIPITQIDGWFERV
ncbi:MAG: DNA mismatch repair endonuclease MutL [Alphaproteobacteria bacterium]|nr:DNA mismatch repair endonuclease MutL [Alphaproteobacteria bacterium]